MSINDGILQLGGLIITALATYGVARLTRSGAREANQTTGWSTLVSALQKEVESLRRDQDSEKIHIAEMDKGNRDLAHRIYVLEGSRRRWKWWGRQVVDVMKERGIICPPPPEPLEDTNPDMEI